jgi:hypothetical protein
MSWLKAFASVMLAAGVFAATVSGATAGVLSPSQDAPSNAQGTPGYFTYGGGGLIAQGFATKVQGPNGTLSWATPLAAVPASVTCIDNVQISSETKGSAIGRAQIDCTSTSSISNGQFELWQRPASTTSGGWTSRGIWNADPSGGKTPYDSGWQPARSCTSGYTIHYEFGADVITPDGGSPEIWNSNNSRCQ